MTMRAIRLDFLQSAPRARGGVVLLAAGLALALAVLSFRAELGDEVRLLESRAAKLERRAPARVPAGMRVDESVRQEIGGVNEIIDQLALPWDRLFSSIERAATGQVTLLGIAPDAKAGTVQISAEAADPEAMFDYLRRLDQQRELSRVYLLQHQRERGAAARPLRFTVVASWMQH